MTAIIDTSFRSTPRVIGPDGQILTIADLPAPGTKRWVIRRKAEVVAAVRGGLISLEACRRYTLSVEEFLSWQKAIDAFGLAGLRTTRLQDYRASTEPPAAQQMALAQGHLAPAE